MNSASRSSPVPSWMASFFLSALIGPWAGPAIAATFEQVDVDQSKLIAIAAPVGTSNNYQLLILEQVADSRPCWQTEGSQPASVDPLLLQFDFTGICSRSTDSNGYSVRLAGEDYGLQYNLRVQRQDNDLLLLAMPFRGKDAPVLVVGRAHGVGSGFLRLDLEPGWRFTKRSFNGQRLGHIYLTHDQSLQDLAQLAAPPPPTPQPASLRETPAVLAALPVTPEMGNPSVATSPPLTTSAPAPTFSEAEQADQPIIIPVPPPESGSVAPANTGIGGPLTPRPIALATSPSPSTPTTTLLTVPTASAPPAPTTPLMATANLPTVRIAPTPGSVPPPLTPRSPSVSPGASTSPAPLPPSRPLVSSVSAPLPPSAATAVGFAYRLVAYADTPQAQNAVRSLIPDTFRVSYNGQVVWQAGLFRASEIDQARSLQQQLRQMNIQTVLLTAQ